MSRNVLLLHDNDNSDDDNTHSNNYSYHLLFAYDMLYFVPEALYAVIIPQNKYESKSLSKFA